MPRFSLNNASLAEDEETVSMVPALPFVLGEVAADIREMFNNMTL